MRITAIFLIVVGLDLTFTVDDYYYDYDLSREEEETTTQLIVERRNLSFFKPGPRPTRKSKPFFKTTTEMCMKFWHKRKVAEEAENPVKTYKPSGNRWHAPVIYGKNLLKEKTLGGRITILRDITQEERKQHKCYKWINSADIKLYSWPAVLQMNPLENTTLIEICCPQYGPVRIWGNTVCHPFCHSCFNGNCIAPEVCQCHDGFVLSDNKDCVFTCPISCLNGRCNILDRKCMCNPGYQPDETGLFCRPICRTGCTNPLHNCTSPDVCSFRNAVTPLTPF